MRGAGVAATRGGEYDRWDLEGRLGAVRLRMTIEEHGQGKQLARYRVWPRLLPRALATTAVSGAGTLVGFVFWAWAAGAGLAGVALLTGVGSLVECGAAVAAVRDAVAEGGRA